MLKITGGSLRGRRIAAPKGKNTRPTSEKVRQGIFDALINLVDLQGICVVDLFAGSGALGIEALSRGAAEVIFVESRLRAADGIRANLKRIEPLDGTGRVVASPVAAWLKRPRFEQPPRLILLDPPYTAGLAEQTLAALASAPEVPADTVICLETAARENPAAPPGLELLRRKIYGDTQVLFYAKSD